MATATTVIEPKVKVSATKLLINGKWVDATSGKTFPTINPSTGEGDYAGGGGGRGRCGQGGGGGAGGV